MPSQTFPAHAVSACGFIAEPADLWIRRITRRHLACAPQLGDVPAWAADALSSHEPWERAAAMEAAGLQAEVQYPLRCWSLFALEDKDLQTACFEAYNSWLFSFVLAAPLRFHGAVLVAPTDAGLIELERCAALGFRTAVIPADLGTPFAERLWAMAARLGLVVTPGVPGPGPGLDPAGHAARGWAFARAAVKAGVLERHPIVRMVVLGGPAPSGMNLPDTVHWTGAVEGGATDPRQLWSRPPGGPVDAAAAAGRAAVIGFHGIEAPDEVTEEIIFAARRRLATTGRAVTTAFGRKGSLRQRSPVLV